jgi:hypothetical protein
MATPEIDRTREESLPLSTDYADYTEKELRALYFVLVPRSRVGQTMVKAQSTKL